MVNLYICVAFGWNINTSNLVNCHSPPCPISLVREKTQAHCPVTLGFFFSFYCQGILP